MSSMILQNVRPDVFPSAVAVVRDEADILAEALCAVSFHRREMYLAFRKDDYTLVKDTVGDLMERAPFLNRYLNGVKSQVYTSDAPDGEMAMIVRFQYSCTYDEMKNRDKMAETEAERIAEYARNSGIQDWKKAYMAISHMVRNWKYGKENLPPGIQYTAYGALVHNQAVCMGFALAVCEIFKKLGIPCRYVHGKRNNGGGHAWNMVYINGGWFYIDVTDAISRQDALYHWGMTKLEDRTIEHPYPETPVCNCDRAWMLARVGTM